MSKEARKLNSHLGTELIDLAAPLLPSSSSGSSTSSEEDTAELQYPRILPHIWEIADERSPISRVERRVDEANSNFISYHEYFRPGMQPKLALLGCSGELGPEQRRVLEGVLAQEPGMMIHLGDNTYEGNAFAGTSSQMTPEDRRIYQEFYSLPYESVDLPVFYLPGNHEEGFIGNAVTSTRLGVMAGTCDVDLGEQAATKLSLLTEEDSAKTSLGLKKAQMPRPYYRIILHYLDEQDIQRSALIVLYDSNRILTDETQLKFLEFAFSDQAAEQANFIMIMQHHALMTAGARASDLKGEFKKYGLPAKITELESALERALLPQERENIQKCLKRLEMARAPGNMYDANLLMIQEILRTTGISNRTIISVSAHEHRAVHLDGLEIGEGNRLIQIISGNGGSTERTAMTLASGLKMIAEDQEFGAAYITLDGETLKIQYLAHKQEEADREIMSYHYHLENGHLVYKDPDQPRYSIPSSILRHPLIEAAHQTMLHDFGLALFRKEWQALSSWMKPYFIPSENKYIKDQKLRKLSYQRDLSFCHSIISTLDHHFGASMVDPKTALQNMRHYLYQDCLPYYQGAPKSGVFRAINQLLFCLEVGEYYLQAQNTEIISKLLAVPRTIHVEKTIADQMTYQTQPGLFQASSPSEKIDFLCRKRLGLGLNQETAKQAVKLALDNYEKSFKLTPDLKRYIAFLRENLEVTKQLDALIKAIFMSGEEIANLQAYVWIEITRAEIFGVPGQKLFKTPISQIEFFTLAEEWGYPIDFDACTDDQRGAVVLELIGRHYFQATNDRGEPLVHEIRALRYQPERLEKVEELERHPLTASSSEIAQKFEAQRRIAKVTFSQNLGHRCFLGTVDLCAQGISYIFTCGGLWNKCGSADQTTPMPLSEAAAVSMQSMSSRGTSPL